MKIRTTSIILYVVVLANMSIDNVFADCSYNFELIRMTKEMVYQKYDGAVIQIKNGNEKGTGFLIDNQHGYVLTAYHTVETAINNSSIEIFGKSSELDGAKKLKYIGDLKDDYLDIALLQFDSSDILKEQDPLEISLRNEKKGSDLYTMGYPDGNHIEYGIGEYTRNTDIESFSKKVKVMEIKGPTRPGRSGGPLINQWGATIGIAIHTDQYENYGLYIPINKVKSLINKLPLSKRIKDLDESIRKGTITEQELVRHLKPGKHLTNTELYLWANHINSNSGDYIKSAKYFKCPIQNALFHRKLDSSIILLSEFVDNTLVTDSLIRQGGLGNSEFNDTPGAKGSSIEQLTDTLEVLLQDQTKPKVKPALKDLAEGKIDKAIEYFKNIADSENHAVISAESYRHMGALEFFKNTNKAQKYYQHATQLDPSNADGWNQLGHLLNRKGYFLEAINAYKKVLEIAENSNNDDLTAVAYGELANAHFSTENHKLAEKLLIKSLEINKKKDNKKGLANIYNDLGNIYLDHDLNHAEKMYRKSLDLNETLDFEEGIASQYGNLGIVHAYRGEFEEAQFNFTKALEISQSLDRPILVANQHGNLGLTYYNRGNMDKALIDFKKSLDINKTLDHTKGMAVQYGNLGLVYYALGDLNQAKETFKKSLEINTKLGIKTKVADQSINLGHIYATRGDLKQAKELFAQAIEVHENLGRQQGVVNGNISLGGVYQMLGDFVLAKELFEKALKISQARELKPSIALSHSKLGFIQYIRGNLVEAENSFNTALQIYSDSHQQESVALNHGNIGLIHYTRGDLDKAKKSFKKGLVISTNLRHKAGISRQNGNLGVINRVQGKLGRAEELFEKALSIEQTIGSKSGTASQYTNLGLVHLIQDDLENAKKLFSKALQLEKFIGDVEGIANNSGYLAVVHRMRNEFDQAETLLKSALEINQSLGYKKGIAFNFGELGVLYRTLGNLGQSEQWLKKALGINQLLGHKKGLAHDYTELGRLYRTRGNLEQAEGPLKKALEINATLGHKRGMADNYAELAGLHYAQSNPEQAKKSADIALDLYNQIGSTKQIEKTQKLLLEINIHVHKTPKRDKLKS